MAELDPRVYTVAWIAPLEIEAQAALHLLDNRHHGRFPLAPRDDYIFQAGDACGHNIIIATLPAGEVYGTRSAAALATQVKRFFPNLWFGLLVGIAAGLPNLSCNPPLDIRLGDVLVGLPVGDNAGLIDYDLGKEVGKEGFQLLRAGHSLAKTETVVRSAIGSIKLKAPNDSNDILQYYRMIEHKEHSLGTFTDPGQDRDTLYQMDESGNENPVAREQRPASRRMRVWYGSIGSGDKLMKNAQKRNELRDKYNIIGLEMEAAGTMDQIPVGVIRGVCDYGDEHKNDEWQPYAAAMAAAYARAVLAEIRPKNDVYLKRKVDENCPASENEHRKRHCYIEEEEHPVSEMTDSAVKQSLIEQLYFDQIDERLMNLTAAQGKTCRWFLAKPEYISWNDASQQPSHGGFLWIKGHPGTGKSTLMKFLFEKAKVNNNGNSPQIILSFFFLARGTVEEKSTTGLYRSLLHQLFGKVPEARHSLEWMTADGAKVLQRNGWNEKALKQTLSHAIQSLGNQPLMIFVDALDECNQSQVADMESQVRLQVCFSSRHYPTITIEKGIEVTLENEIGHTEDIEHYIKSKLRLGKSSQADSLRSEILDKSSNIFLWVVSISIKKIRDRLREIPPELNDLFEMILTRDGEHLDRLHICLKWILFANRPLKSEELYFAVQFGSKEECSGYWDRNEVEFKKMKIFVRSSSKGLAEVTRNKASEVQFIHESVRDFLLHKYEAQCHKLLRDSCLSQLNSLTPQGIGIENPLPRASETAQLRKRIRSDYPFLEYSICNVLHHANFGQQNGLDQGRFLADFPLQKWILFNNALGQYQIRRYNNSVSLLYILAERNLASLIRIHPQKSCFFDIEADVERYGTPIMAALATNSHDAVCAFLKTITGTVLSTSFHSLCELHCVDTKTSGIFGRDFSFSRRRGILSYLAEEGNEILFRAFISSKKSEKDLRDTPNPSQMPQDGHNTLSDNYLNRTDVIGRTPLLWAAEKGHIALTQWLLAQSGIDINCKDIFGHTPLFFATKNEHISIIRLLLAQSGIDPNCKSIGYTTPLLWAAERGQIATIQLLVAQNGIDLNCVDKGGQTPMLRAAERGQIAIIQLLVAQHGIDLNCVDKDGQTPMLRATERGHVSIVELLLAQDDGGGRTPLLWAVSKAEISVLKLLLAKPDVDLTCKDTFGITPLSLAAAFGHLSIVQLLLKQGIDLNCRDDTGRNCHGLLEKDIYLFFSCSLSKMLI
ncbi:hypothetical protein V8C35DRAFT_321097 [Trichoderma chlorosporum]